ncbi:MAG: tripartite tricarboxylate transporter permease [Candidatus Pacearchaeota archaeon]
MFLEIVIALLLGTLAGIFTGMIPGIHINLVGAIIVSLSASIFADIPALYLVVFIVSMSITHVFIDFIPSIFLGAPEDGTELSVLPGHEMLKKGLGLQAVKLSALGCLFGVFIFIIASFPLSLIAKDIYKFILSENIIAILLIGISLNLIFVEKKKFLGLAVFAITGILGLTVLNIGMKEPLLPLLSGLFGTSTLLLSIRDKTKIQKQTTEKNISIKKLKPIITAALTSPLSIFLPAISSGQIAVIGNQFAKLPKESFLFMLGAINALTMSFSFLAFFLISKTRTGSAVAVESLFGTLTTELFILIAGVILISGIISFFLTGSLSKKFLSVLERTNYSKICIATIAVISIITLLVSGTFGLLVLIVSTLTGVYCISLGVSRVNMMGCLLLQTILFYLL